MSEQAGTPAYVQLPPNSTGTKIRTQQEVDEAGNNVQAEIVHIADANVVTDLLAIIMGALQTNDFNTQALIQQLIAKASTSNTDAPSWGWDAPNGWGTFASANLWGPSGW